MNANNRNTVDFLTISTAELYQTSQMNKLKLQET